MKYLIVDANNLGFRTLGTNVNNRSGHNSGTIYWFLSSIADAIKALKIDRCIVVWDYGKSSWRANQLETYKESRKKQHSEESSVIFEQLMFLQKEVLPLLPVVQLSKYNVEADDIIFACVDTLTPENECYIFSSDSDFWQLLDQASIWTGKHLFTGADFQKKFHFPSSKYVEYKAMVGDYSDCIKGVKGVGDKTARYILTEYGSTYDFITSNDDKAKKLFTLDAVSIFYRNKILIGLENFPDTKMLSRMVSKDLKDLKLMLQNKELLSVFRRKMMIPMVSSWPILRNVYQRLS